MHTRNLGHVRRVQVAPSRVVRAHVKVQLVFPPLVDEAHQGLCRILGS